MTELHLLYTFLALMIFNLLASVVYLMGLKHVRLAVKRVFRSRL